MEVKEGYVYHIKDEYFEVVQDDTLMKNHENGKTRPTETSFSKSASS